MKTKAGRGAAASKPAAGKGAGTWLRRTHASFQPRFAADDDQRGTAYAQAGLGLEKTAPNLTTTTAVTHDGIDHNFLQNAYHLLEPCSLQEEDAVDRRTPKGQEGYPFSHQRVL